MSTETTNKKIKIDNGTTFGRTYTDKAVDELLKGVGGQKVYTCAITDLLSISDIQSLIGVITSSQSSTAKRYNLLKSIDDIINEYDYIYVDTSALQMTGGLTFRKQINAGTNKNFALCYGYFNFDSSSNKISSFANIVISLSDAWYVETISSLTLLPNVDGTGANNGKVLTFDTNSLGTNGVPYKWAEVGGRGSISVIELTDKNGTIASTQLNEINANPQNFAFKYKGKILLFTSADSTTYQYCNNTTSSSDNNVMTTSILLTITSSTGVYTIAENVHNVVANSIHPANGGDLTNIQVGSKVYSIPSGGGGVEIKSESLDIIVNAKSYNVGDYVYNYINASTYGASKIYPVNFGLLAGSLDFNIQGDCKFIPIIYNEKVFNEYVIVALVCIKAGTVSSNSTVSIEADFILK